MTVLETIALYYDAWQNKQGDFSQVPLADDFEFIGPVASFDTAEGYRAMAAEAGQAGASFAVRPEVFCGENGWSIVGLGVGIARVRRLASGRLVAVHERLSLR